MADSKKYDGSQWEHSLRKLTTATEAVENPLYSDGTAITAYTLKGNTSTSGTPTPSNPITISGVGNKTANLFDKSKRTDNSRVVYTTGEIGDLFGVFVSDFTPIEPNTTYTLNIVSSISGKTGHLFALYDENKNFVNTGAHEASSTTVVYTFTTPSNVAYIRFNGNMSSVDETMLNTGSTAKPFEPFGVKIPISSGQQTIDIYIGDLPLLKSLDGTVVDEISNGTLTRRVDADGSVLPTPTTTQITMPSIPTTDGANSITVDTTVQPSEFTATWTGWHNAYVKEKSENLIPTNIIDWEQGGISSTTGTDTVSTIRLRTKDYYPIENDTDYYISVNDTDYCYVNIILYNSSKQYVGQYYIIDASINGATALAINIPSSTIANVNYYRVVLKRQDDNTILANEISNVKPMLNLGSTAQTYEPYWK